MEPTDTSNADGRRIALPKSHAVLSARVVASIIVALALALRLHNVGFGLPSLYDPDEPLFMVKAATLLKDRTIDPHWFGHPATTTLYLTALVQVAVFAVGRLAGRFGDIAGFVHAAYLDPAIVFLPARTVMAAMGAVCVGLTYILGKRLAGPSVGLLAATLVALNSLHISWSQVVRSDVQASVFMLAALIIACRLADTGSRKDALLAGLCTGFAIATKWPAATAFAGVAGAALCAGNGRPRDWIKAGKLAGLAGVATILGLFLASPFVFLDYPTVIANLAGEARPFHVGHTGNGFLSNLGVYLAGFGVDSMGWIGIVLAIGGGVVLAIQRGKAGYVLLPATFAFFISIAAPRLVWSRWLVPGLPYLAILASVMVLELARRFGRDRYRELLAAGLACVALAPSAAGAIGQSRERQNDTRAQAAQWILTHAPAGSTVILEHLELSLRDRPYRFLFPLGRRGCQDGRNLLTSNISYGDLEQARGGSPVVDLGSVDRSTIGTCRGDFAILTYYDEYVRDAQRFPAEVATYRAILAGGRTVAMFRPAPGRVGGPTVRIVALPPRR